MRRPLLLVLVLPLAISLLSGCGSDDSGPPTKAEFRQDYAPISAEIRSVGNDVGSAVSTAKGKSDIEIQNEFADLADRANAAATKLDEVEPPDDAAIEAAQTQLVAGVRKAAGDLDAIATAATTGDAAAAKAATIRLVRDSAAVRTPRRKLDQLALSSES